MRTDSAGSIERRVVVERENVITMKGSGLTLVGPEIRPGDKAPDFTVLDQGLGPVSLGDFAGKVKVISVTPSLDTPVCDMQARRFNEEAASLPEKVVVLNISVDLPFAIARFCAAAGIDRVKVLSDHRETSFGKAYGVLIKELRLLARAIFIVDTEDVIRYVEIVPEVSNPPDYGRALTALESIR
jgi:thiol peroxidase